MPANRLSKVVPAEDAQPDGPAIPVPVQEAVRDLQRMVAKWTIRDREHLEESELRDIRERRSQTEFFLQIIEVLDKLGDWLQGEDFQLAKAAPASATWVNRLELASKMLFKLLSKYQVVPLDLIGKAPPGSVSVVDKVEIAGVEQETIHEVIERGWIWRDEVLRTSTVIVAVPAASSANTAMTGQTSVMPTEVIPTADAGGKPDTCP